MSGGICSRRNVVRTNICVTLTIAHLSKRVEKNVRGIMTCFICTPRISSSPGQFPFSSMSTIETSYPAAINAVASRMTRGSVDAVPSTCIPTLMSKRLRWKGIQNIAIDLKKFMLFFFPAEIFAGRLQRIAPHTSKRSGICQHSIDCRCNICWLKRRQNLSNVIGFRAHPQLRQVES